MKKLTALLLIVTMLFSFSACNNTQEENGNNPSEETASKTASELLDIVLQSVDFPETIPLEDESRIETELKIDLSSVEDYAIVQQMLSVDVVEVIILKLNESASVSDMVKVLEQRKDSLINEFAFYPDQVKSAEATVVGSEKNVVYLICHVDAATAEEYLKEQI